MSLAIVGTQDLTNVTSLATVILAWWKPLNLGCKLLLFLELLNYLVADIDQNEKELLLPHAIVFCKSRKVWRVWIFVVILCKLILNQRLYQFRILQLLKKMWGKLCEEREREGGEREVNLERERGRRERKVN